MCKRFNIGGEFFDKIRENGSYYVDKTEILYDLLSDNTIEVALFTRPRQFGKILMMSMMENFFNINKDSKNIFEGLNIMKHPEICKKHMNQHPVIFVSFKGVEGLSFESAYETFKNVIAGVCRNIVGIMNKGEFMQCRANTRDFSHEIQPDIYFTKKKYHISKICGIIRIQEYLFPSLRKEKTVCI